MKSRTSFFNFTVLRKDIFRYAPVWGLYTIGLLLFLLVPNLDWESADVADSLLSNLSSMALVNIVLGGISALLVFGDLFKTRLCYATHALPLRREGWFLTHFTAGFLFSFVPNLLITLCFLPLLRRCWFVAPIWLIVMTLQYLFFFGVGAFCAVCAGNRLGATAIYLIVNLGALLINTYAENFYAPLLYGTVYQDSFVQMLVPVSHLSDLEYVLYLRKPFQFHSLFTADWLYLLILAGIGLVFSVAAVLIYRKRNLETAGDFLSLPAAKPAFLIVYTLAVGYLFSELIAVEYLGMFAGLLVGFFTGRMLLERTVKVFRGWNFLGFGVLITVFALSIGITALDPVGITRYVPDTEDIKYVQFYDSSDRHLYQVDDNLERIITDPAEIEQFRQFHSEVSDGRYQASNENAVSLYLQYELTNGKRVLRRYNIPVESTHGDFARVQLSSWQSVFHINKWDIFSQQVEMVDLETTLTFSDGQIGHFTLSDPRQVQGLLEAVKADCAAGNMAQSWAFHPEEDSLCWLYIYDSNYYQSEIVANETLAEAYKAYSYSLTVFASCTNTLAYVESLNLDVEPYVK